MRCDGIVALLSNCRFSTGIHQTRSRREGSPAGRLLRANDIYNLKLPAELVVLSACQTGLGKGIKGEGLVGLTRGFMYAGSARVVVSLAI